jgi:hydrogenase maturation protein HypF
LALAFDGTGLGPDGSIWGAELLHVTLTGDTPVAGCTRLGTFAGVPLPGADAAVREPGRQVVARWWAAGLQPTDARLAALGVSPNEAELWRLQCARGLNAPVTHAAGRLFDAAAVLAGVAPRRISYEGQAAVRLESLATRTTSLDSAPEIPFSTRRAGDVLLIDWSELFSATLDAPPVEPAAWARAFHQAVAGAALAMARHGREVTGCEVVALTGGVWMNRLLANLARARLEAVGFRVLEHARVPPNDGGVALGQAVVAGLGEGPQTPRRS